MGMTNSDHWRVECGPYQEGSKLRGLVLARWEGLDYIMQAVGVLYYPHGLVPEPNAPFAVEAQLHNGYTRPLEGADYPSALRPFVIANWTRPAKQRDIAWTESLHHGRKRFETTIADRRCSVIEGDTGGLSWQAIVADNQIGQEWPAFIDAMHACARHLSVANANMTWKGATP